MPAPGLFSTITGWPSRVAMRQAGEVQAVMASLVMMIAGAVNVLAAPWVRVIFF
ncbi:hypothetical protein NOX35_21995 [Comamonas sp. C11]|nr:hypothetical protein [Comamonas sp. C11]UUC96377.1 hypothetical protein NOX35_21995 [Comamonas sp. C11]